MSPYSVNSDLSGHALLGDTRFECTLRMEDDSACGLRHEQIHQRCTTHAAQNDDSVPRIENNMNLLW